MPENNRFSNFGAREKSTRQSQTAILIAVSVALLSLLPALYRWTARSMLRRNLHHLGEKVLPEEMVDNLTSPCKGMSG